MKEIDELDFKDKEYTQKFNRSGYGSSIKSSQKRIRKQNKLREIEQLLEERRLQKELHDLYQLSN